ncbi:Hsp20/alpha crystallin family protein [Pseudalkalibacillus caeni]|uniref:Hsp20/alpha crystallin family protein n=1 Tax=Exobacillus caeni TaxID=2574798 RepID=A0A5R9EVY0_9BACL|nr:Hsp20/alpha crystallin family protein [Pseudalkalibacillus caeni]TLS34961.1 Hsp20/alpha crystallin family protein [Pseudalkalibacillus caeni]
MEQWNKFHDWKKNMNKFMGNDFWNEFQDMFAGNGPLVNLYESGNELLCLINVPGLSNINDVDLYVHYRTLKIRGKTRFSFKGFRVIQEEIHQGNFERIVELPFPVRDKPIDATYKKGVLMVHLHRLVESQEKDNRIQIKNLEDKD